MSADALDPIEGIHLLLTKYASAPREAQVYVPQFVGELRQLRVDTGLVIVWYMRIPIRADRQEVLSTLENLMLDVVHAQVALDADLSRNGYGSFEEFEESVLKAETEASRDERGE